MRAALRWLRIEDSGALSLTALSLYIGLGCLLAGYILPLIVGAFLYAVKRLTVDAQTRLAMEGAQEAALSRLREADVEALGALQKEVKALGAKVHELTLPDRDAALKRIRGGQ